MAFHLLLSYVLAMLSCEALAAIGPVTDLNIGNAVIAPDGFSRSCVFPPDNFLLLKFSKCCSC